MIKKIPIELAAQFHLEQGGSVTQSATKFNVPVSSLYAFLRRREFQLLKGKVECPCCGSLVDPVKIDPGTLSAIGKKKLTK